MRTRLVVTGLVVLVIGIALVGAAESGLRARTTSFTTFSQPRAGEYVSAEMVLNVTSLVEVRSPPAVGGLLTASNLDAADSSNIGVLAIPYNSSTVGTDSYTSLKGDYYYVVFSSAQPSTKIVAAVRSSAIVEYALLALAGLALLVAGIVVAVVGAVRKGSQRPATVSEEEYYAKRKT